jgi:putative membrane protein
MWHMNGIGWSGWLLMSLGFMVFSGLVIYAVMRLARSGGRGAAEGGPESQTVPARAPAEKPEDILGRRLAAGELAVDEYQAVRQALTAADRAPAPGA